MQGKATKYLIGFGIFMLYYVVARILENKVAAICLQGWMLREIIGLGRRMTRIETIMGLDTRFFRKPPSKD